MDLNLFGWGVLVIAVTFSAIAFLGMIMSVRINLKLQVSSNRRSESLYSVRMTENGLNYVIDSGRNRRRNGHTLVAQFASYDEARIYVLESLEWKIRRAKDSHFRYRQNRNIDGARHSLNLVTHLSKSLNRWRASELFKRVA